MSVHGGETSEESVNNRLNGTLPERLIGLEDGDLTLFAPPHGEDT